MRAFGVGGAARLDQLQKIDPFAAIYNTGDDLLAAVRLNNSARYAGEPGMAGVRVYLDLNNDRVWQSATEPSTLTTADDPDTSEVDEAGAFRISNLTPGTHTVREVIPSGYVQIKPGASGGLGYSVSVTAGMTVTGLYFGNAANPRITGAPASTTYDHGAGAILLASSAAVTDLDTPILNGGQLTVRVKTTAHANDQVRVLAQGSGPGNITISGNSIAFGGVVIGSFTGGTGNVALVITFNGSATITAVQALVRRISFRNTLANAPLTARILEWKLTDGEGGISALVNETVNVV